MADLIAGELHDVDVIGVGALTGRWAGATFAAMGAGEHAVGADTAAFAVGRKRLHHIAPVRDEGQQPLHPFGVGLQRLDLGKRLRLRGEGGGGRAIGTAALPSLAGLARVEETLGNGGYVGHLFLPVEDRLTMISVLRAAPSRRAVTGAAILPQAGSAS